MPEFNLAITFSSFIAGVLTFFAPCTLPLVPAFLGIISGARVEDLKNPELVKSVRGRIFKNAIFYVLGFSLIFILFGVSFTFVSQVFGIKEWIQRIGGIMIILFGLVLMGWLRIPFLSSEKQISVPRLFHNVSLLNSFLLGAIFAVGWSPCVGPLLGSVLLLASTSGTVVEGTFLLIVFSIGLGIPFLITALLIGKAFDAFGRWGKILGIINKVAGLFLIFMGILLVIGQFEQIHILFTKYFNRFPMFEVFLNKFL
jgi:cytochrome c-type biogenesis protein